MTNEEKELLAKISDLHELPEGAYNIRLNGEGYKRHSTEDIEIVPKTDKPGIDIIVKPNVVGRSVHIPVIVSRTGLKDLVYNDFYIGEGSDVLIVAGCGIHNTGDKTSEHNGIHAFHLGKNCKVKYVERHFGQGKGDRVLNPVTEVELGENSSMIMETTQMGGVSNAIRTTNANVGKNASLVIKEKILTTNSQIAETNFNVELIGENSSVDVVSRSVAKDDSSQTFHSNVVGKNKSFGHVECDAIMTGQSHVKSIPEIDAIDNNATLVHEASIGKIAGDQLIKLMTLGLDEHQAEDLIIQGFLNN